MKQLPSTKVGWILVCVIFGASLPHLLRPAKPIQREFPGVSGPFPGEVGAPIPEIHGPCVDGSQWSSASASGRVILFHGWAAWSRPSRTDLPRIRTLHRQYASMGLVVIGLSADEDVTECREMMASAGLTWPQLYDGKGWQMEAFHHLNIDRLPGIVLVGADGKMLLKDPTPEQLEAELRSLFPLSKG